LSWHRKYRLLLSMLIGLTGQIGAGKSAVAAILAEHGAVVVDADRIGREVVDNSQSLRLRLAREFGKDILTPTGRLRRKRLAELAFAGPGSKARLDCLFHPYLLRELRRQVKAARRLSELVVIDAALLLNWNLDREVDETWVVTAARDKRLSRMAARGFSRHDTAAREKAQLPLGEYRRRATRVIANNGTIAELKRKVERLLSRLCAQTH
jgi:dephospho-CoA kinase